MGIFENPHVFIWTQKIQNFFQTDVPVLKRAIPDFNFLYCSVTVLLLSGIWGLLQNYQAIMFFRTRVVYSSSRSTQFPTDLLYLIPD